MSSRLNALEEPAPKSPDRIICQCEDLTHSEMNRLLGTDPGMTFDDFLSRTGAGNTCTACLLDLEYEFVTFSTSSSGAAAFARITRRNRKAGSLKQRLYGFIDRFSPKIPAPLTDVIPILSAPDIQQNLIVSNQSLLFDDTFIAPDFEVGVVIRAADGREIYRTTRLVRSGETWRQDLSAPIAEIAEVRTGEVPFAVGSALVRRRALRSGFRGTTRPQTEIIGSGGTSAVHLQGASFNTGGGVVFDGRPETRRFVSFVSLDKSPVEIEVGFPLPLGSGAHDFPSPHSQRLRLPPNGAAIVEIPADARSAGSTEASPLISVGWTGRGIYKAHGYNGDRALTRMAIDHL